MAEQGDGQDYSWFESRAFRRASDIALGATLVVVATLAMANVSGVPFGHRDRLSEWFFPSVVAGLLVVAGIILIIRGAVLGHDRPGRWSLGALSLIAAGAVAAYLAAGQWGNQLALHFGPSEYATFIVFVLVLAVALARRSRVRAVGMALLGLLLSVVGVEISSGVTRLTMGFPELADGISTPFVALGFLVVAESAICFVSPALLLQTYAGQVAGWVGPRVPAIAEIGMRLAAALAMAAACVFAFRLNNSTGELGEVLLFGLFGVACKILGWNRLVLILALAGGGLLEENIRRAMLISRGDPTVFVRWPFSATLVLLACCILLAVAFVSARPAPGPGRETA